MSYPQSTRGQQGGERERQRQPGDEIADARVDRPRLQEPHVLDEQAPARRAATSRTTRPYGSTKPLIPVFAARAR